MLNAASFGLLWIPIVVWAALAQTVRNAAQRSLVADVGAMGATLVRFLYGLPLAATWVIALRWLDDTALPVPHFSLAYAGWILLGAVAQIGATACLLMAMRDRNFVIAVLYSKTEVIQIALIAGVVLHEFPSALGWAAIVLASAGVMLLSVPRGGQPAATGGHWRMVAFGLGSGLGFALAGVGFRGASVALGPEVSPWVAGGWGVLYAQLVQSVLLLAWLGWRQPAGVRAVFRAWKLSTLAGSMGALASIAWFTAYAIRPAADIRTLGMVEVLFSYVVSRRVFGETLSRKEGIGLVMIVGGLILLCAGAGWTG